MEITVACSKCNTLKRVSRIHISHPIVLVLECNHKVEITDISFGVSQEL